MPLDCPKLDIEIMWFVLHVLCVLKDRVLLQYNVNNKEHCALVIMQS